MKLSNLRDVNTAQRILSRIDNALATIKAYHVKTASERPDPGGIPDVAEYGYNAVLSQYGDGSSAIADLAGCYVANEMAEQAQIVLLKKRAEVVEYLKKVGVEIDSEEGTDDE